MTLTMRLKKKNHSMMKNSTLVMKMDLKIGMTKMKKCQKLKRISLKSYKMKKNQKIWNKKSWTWIMSLKKLKMKLMSKNMKMKF